MNRAALNNSRVQPRAKSDAWASICGPIFLGSVDPLFSGPQGPCG